MAVSCARPVWLFLVRALSMTSSALAPPIDLEGDDSPDGVLVPVPGSPPKRPKTNLPTASLLVSPAVDSNQLITLIQTTIQDSVASNLAFVSSSVQTFVDRVSKHDDRLGKIEQVVGRLSEMEASHSGRMDSLQQELKELQKTMTSPGAPSVGVEVAREEIGFDIVVGGWREGSTRAWVERELAQLIASVGLSTQVSQIKTFDKRPGVAKLELAFDAHLPLPRRREQQLQVLTKLRAGNWQPEDATIWMTTDKPLKQRRVSKAIAILNNFLHSRLGLDRGILEVASWVAAKAFVGDYRVTGLSEENAYGAKPACASVDLRWLVRDPRAAVNVWLDLDALANGLQLDKQDLASKWSDHVGRDSA